MNTTAIPGARPKRAEGRSLSRLRPSPAFLLLVPALLYLAAMTQAPFLLTAWYSLHTWILTSPQLGHPWVGLDNFRYEISNDPIFRQALVNSLVMTTGIVGLSLGIGLAFALLLNRTFRFRGIVRAAMIAPFFVMPTVSGIVWKNLFLNPIFGFLSWATTSVGLPRLDLLSTHAKLSVIGIASWQWTPFMMLILLAGLQGIPDDVREAAKVDGASATREFFSITLPLLGSYFELAILLGVMYVLQLFGEIFVTTQGGPGTETTTLPYYVYQTVSQANDVGTASAQGLLGVVFASIIAAFLLRISTRTLTRGGLA
jgi:sorbitol/mannitol transport system permease protein